MAQRLLPHRQAWEPAIHKRDGCAWLYLDARLLLARAVSVSAGYIFTPKLKFPPVGIVWMLHCARWTRSPVRGPPPAMRGSCGDK